jgi:hypothetical protein
MRGGEGGMMAHCSGILCEKSTSPQPLPRTLHCMHKDGRHPGDCPLQLHPMLGRPGHEQAPCCTAA